MSHDVREGNTSKNSPSPDASQKYVPGEIIADKYRLVRRLGEGGMGAVWIARNLALDVQVAIKLIRSDVDTDGAAERLLTEARAAARLKHPSIVRVFDFGRTRHDDPFIVMELLTGENLGEVLDREAMITPVSAVQLLLPIAEALSAAHAQDIVHRDIKPENFFLAEAEGRLHPKVLDFGIAKVEGKTRGRVTQAGTILGSPDYLSPEQARGDEIDHRADVWAFSIVLYECITGRVPFDDENYHALLRRIIEEEVRPISSYGLGDEDLWQIIDRGLRKDPAERWSTMRELGTALAGWLIDQGVAEDACGQSLRAAWFDPRASYHDLRGALGTSGRISRPPSSVRNPPPSSRTPTKSALTVSPSSERPATVRPRRFLLFAVGAVALMSLIVIGFMSVRKLAGTLAVQPAARIESGVSAPAQPHPVATAAATASASSAASPEAVPAAPIPSSAPSAARNTPERRRRARPPQRKAAAGAATADAASKPKSTYEDFGF